jgi:hypothetical protein
MTPARPGQPNRKRKSDMSSYNKEIQITGGDTEERHSHGKFWIDIDLETREVAVTFPDRVGVPGSMYTFAPEDWDAIVTVINEAELQRGKVVSANWIGQ